MVKDHSPDCPVWVGKKCCCVGKASPYKLVGYLVWNTMNKDSKEFTRLALTETDKKNGYCSQPVYIDIREGG